MEVQSSVKNGTKDWTPLKILKESNPVDVTEFATARGFADETAFSWWVTRTLRKRNPIIAAANSRAKKQTHKFGLKL